MDTTRALGPRIMGLVLLVISPLSANGQNSPFKTYIPAPPAIPPGIETSGGVAKTQVDPAYATLYGGTGYDELLDHAVSGGVACMVGPTSSTDLTLFQPFQEDNAGNFDGWIACGDFTTSVPFFASYLGSTDEEIITGVDIHGDTVYVVGVTTSMTMPGADTTTYQTVSGGGQDCFVARMNVFDGSGLRTTLFGLDGDEYCSDISVGKHGVWIGGTTNKLIDLVNPLQDVVKGPSDAFLALLRGDLSSVRFSTLLGGEDADGGERIGVTHLYKDDEVTKRDESGTEGPPDRVDFTGWARGEGAPVTANAFQMTHGGGYDVFYASLIYDYDMDAADLAYFSFAGKEGDEVPRDMGVSKEGVSITGWTTSVDWNTIGRGRNSGPSDGFMITWRPDETTSIPRIGYVGPSEGYNLPLAVDYTQPGLSVVAGYTEVPSMGNAFMQALDLNYRVVANEFAGGAAPADCKTVMTTPFWWVCGGRTGGPISTTQFAIQADFGGEYDMFGSKYQTSYSFSHLFNLTNDVITGRFNDYDIEPIAPRSAGRFDALRWNVDFTYELAGGGRTYQFERLYDDQSPKIDYTYLLGNQSVRVSVPLVERGTLGILAYNELDRPVDVYRTNQEVDHEEVNRATVEAGQFFFIPLPKDQNVGITDGIDFIDYRPPKKRRYSDYPYLSGVLQERVEKGSGSQGFELLLFDAQGEPVELPVTTSTEESEVMPQGFALFSNHPNPFRASTTILFETPETASVRLEVFDIMGRRVRTLVDGLHAAGAGSVEWDGRNDAGRAVSSGTYLARLEVDGYAVTGTMVLAR
ncbi:MAG TPA: FlgD immunoglobulin-like domain containing protein [Rhodothermales bacterium]|nr:FlgD immunoglobulin-like domain containing protein [Rhodothermales bacterium]